MPGAEHRHFDRDGRNSILFLKNQDGDGDDGRSLACGFAGYFMPEALTLIIKLVQ